MPIIKYLKEVVLEALFPIPEAERELLKLGPIDSWKILPRASKSSIREACSIFSYKDERVRRMIWAIKYKKSREAAIIGAYALANILAYFSRAVDHMIIVPMPITKKRRRERGFNQCELVVEQIRMAEQIYKPHEEKRLEITTDFLFRVGHKSRQTLKDRQDRIESAAGLFVVNNKTANRVWLELGDRQSPSYMIIVVDDVITTGSTMRDAVSTMRKHGFTETFGLSIAH